VTISTPSREDVYAPGAFMRRVLPLVIVLATAALVAAGWSGAGALHCALSARRLPPSRRSEP